MKTLVFYLFSYSNKRPRSPTELSSSLQGQLEAVERHVRTMGLPQGSFHRQFCVLTNRDRHFADTDEFRQAVRRAAETNGALVLVSLRKLLERTRSGLILAACQTLHDVPVEIISISEPTFDKRMLQTFAIEAMSFKLAKEAHQKRGAAQGKTLTRDASARNQPKAAAGARSAAARRALSVAPVVDAIEKESAPDGSLSPASLAAALNARGVAAPQGGKWQRSSASNLLKRLRPTHGPTD